MKFIITANNIGVVQEELEKQLADHKFEIVEKHETKENVLYYILEKE